jgi:hypothetical protein
MTPYEESLLIGRTVTSAVSFSQFSFLLVYKSDKSKFFDAQLRRVKFHGLFIVFAAACNCSHLVQATMTTERYEEAKEELKKTMTVKMMKKKEQVTLKLQRKAQQETATLVTKHAQQMLELLQSKQEELQKELEDEILVSTG